MHIKPDCITCIMNQTLKVTKLLQLDDATSKTLLDETAKILIESSLEMTPPQIAQHTYASIAALTGIDDPVARSKEEATKAALSVDTSFVTTLHDAVKFAVIGNVIDFGAQQTFDLNEVIQSHFHKEFGIDDFEAFQNALKNANSLVYLGDNTGEHVFDRLLIEKIKETYNIDVYYFVRGKPIINDVTVKEAKLLEEVATIVDTGVPTPGFDLDYANAYAKNLFETSDIVLSKGMGNYESLYDVCDRSVFYLFIIKCNVVSNAIGQPVGEMVFTEH